jgi:RNA polymerase sigma factor (sigma-70 family)
MTKEETKLWLRSYRAKKLEAEDLDRKIQELEADIDNPKTTRFDKLPGSSHADGSPTERLYVKGVAMVEKYKELRADLLDGMSQIEDTIAGLNETERLLFRCRYIDGLTWEEVAVTINYSWSQMHTIHSQALDKLSD